MPNEMMPIRPISITKMMTTRLNGCISLTVPVGSPTVENIDTASKNILPSGISSVRHRNIVVRKTTLALTKKMLSARKMIIGGTVRSKMTTSSRPRIKDQIAAKITAIVVVLMPPPVEAGEPPINIKNIMKSSVGSVSAFMSSMEKPEVRDMEAMNRLAIIFSRILYGASVPSLPYSRMKMKTVPIRIKMAVVASTIFVLIPNFFE